MERASRETSEDVSNAAVERFERRLVAEMSQVRLDIERGFGVLRQELASTRVELIRWSFLFWIGQVAAILGMLAVMVRVTGH
jgi:hypothetical protein